MSCIKKVLSWILTHSFKNEKSHTSRYHQVNFKDAFIDKYHNCFAMCLLFAEDQLAIVIRDLYHAGTETVSTTLKWALVYLLNYPQVLHQVQEEIAEVLGGQTEPSMRHRARMPYTEATIMEVQRMGDLAPFGAGCCPAEDVELRGYTIPKATVVIPNLNSVHRDDKHFPEPFHFDPGRFLKEDGRLRRVEQLIPFSKGDVVTHCFHQRHVMTRQVMKKQTSILSKLLIIQMTKIKFHPSWFW